MIIKSAEFIISAVSAKQYPEEGLPEIALAGRSNVGKSSLINKIINRKNLARTSSQPGKTQTLNYYKINEEFYFVDLPGYGFAKVSKELRNKWAEFIEDYLSKREVLQGVIHIIDVRHPPTGEDCMMYDWLTHFKLPTLVVATKADKISRGQWQKHIKEIKVKMKLPASQQLVLFSKETGQGLPEITKWIEDVKKDA
ncbi:GTP-binding protein [Desulfonispora thiosulfatigenes DSM 11270]|uniref:Probable GTP-binding protein EngB n=1 Tax=Desulfonispora thiosulfatigenes DSM 11270 TaxID=656914 RepID=A0A1W1V962_DESTI|nr:ribosome biogenesis GTP-binding protein YihA/YsxC [Desulfonispora thiosulfatigenes]SMB89524.1 GTP-binding protein [Desulfonispora thiosulfatigenes DSM 11270]